MTGTRRGEWTIHQLQCFNHGLMKELIVKHFLTVLLTMVAVGFAQSKSELSVVIRPVDSTVKASSGVASCRQENQPHRPRAAHLGVQPGG
jgi:hypothetical protein